MSYKDANEEHNFDGHDIARTETQLGELVTVLVKRVDDVLVRYFTVIVPKVNLNEGEEVEFDTLGIQTLDRSLAFVEPPGPPGVSDAYRVHQLHGKAQHVRP
jgi:hypothetical protein